MTPLHALILGIAVVVVCAAVLAWAMCAIAGRDDDEHGRPRG